MNCIYFNKCLFINNKKAYFFLVCLIAFRLDSQLLKCHKDFSFLPEWQKQKTKATAG